MMAHSDKFLPSSTQLLMMSTINFASSLSLKALYTFINSPSSFSVQSSLPSLSGLFLITAFAAAKIFVVDL